MTQPPAGQFTINAEDVIARLDEHGRAKWDLAQQQVINEHLQAELARVSNELEQVRGERAKAKAGSEAEPAPEPAVTDRSGA